MTTLRESMTRIALEHVTIRIWREEPLNAKVNNRDLWNHVKKLVGTAYNPLTLGAQILEFDRVSAVEILDKNSQGEVIYKNWP